MDLLWSTGGQTTSSITGLSAAVYTVTISDGAGCQLDTTVTVDEPLPLTVTAMADASICSGASLTLTATSAGGTGAVAFAWSPAGPSVSPTVTTTYSVIATDANGCTSAADPVDVNVGNAITPIITNSLAQGCAPWCVDFSTVTAGVTFTWAYSDGASGSGASVSHCFADAGSYDVTLTVTDADGCSGTLNAPDLVTVAPIPEASFVPAPSVAIISSPTFILNNTSGGGLNFVWSFGDPQGSTSTAPSPSITYSAVGCYTVELLATNDAGCADAERMELCVEDEFALYVPNTFTPNDDGLNDVFGVITSVRDPQAFELRVFDRWGGELWVSTDANTPWTGATVPDGVYAWTVNLLDATGKQRKQRGHVVLLR